MFINFNKIFFCFIFFIFAYNIFKCEFKGGISIKSSEKSLIEISKKESNINSSTFEDFDIFNFMPINKKQEKNKSDSKIIYNLFKDSCTLKIFNQKNILYSEKTFLKFKDYYLYKKIEYSPDNGKNECFTFFFNNFFVEYIYLYSLEDDKKPYLLIFTQYKKDEIIKIRVYKNIPSKINPSTDMKYLSDKMFDMTKTNIEVENNRLVFKREFKTTSKVPSIKEKKSDIKYFYFQNSEFYKNGFSYFWHIYIEEVQNALL